MIVGITGSIGSGKTTAAKIFSKYHFTRIDADKIGHDLIKKDSIAYKKIIKAFGNKILDKNNDIDRKKLGDIVFNDGKKLGKLNSIMHPQIINETKKQIERIKSKCGAKTRIIIDAPLLLETETKDLVDRIVVVKADKSEIVKRLNERFPKGIIEKILNTQMQIDEKLKYADFVIENSGNLKNLEKQVMSVLNTIQKKK